MTWFKIDDAWWRSRKVRKLGRRRVSVSAQVAGAGVWSLAGDWAADNLTDGFVPWEVVEDWDPRREVAARLIEVGFWLEVDYDGEAGVQFHDWADWQPTKEQVVATRQYNARKSALYRDPELLEVVRKRDNDRCRYCGEKVNWRDRRSAGGGTYDHVNPHGPNSADNLVVACRRCNSRKCDKSAAERGMVLLDPGATGLRSGANPDPVRSASRSHLDTEQIGSRSVQDPDPTRPDPTRKKKKNTLTDAAASAAFEEFWTHYPRKADKRAAERAYKQAMSRDVTPDHLLTAVKTYAATCRGTEPRFIKHASTWLNAGAYDNNPDPALRMASGGSAIRHDPLTGVISER